MIALVTVVAGRHDHLRLQRDGLRAATVRPDVEIVVSMGDPDIAEVSGPDALVVDVDTPAAGLPVAAARNAGARAAIATGADTIIFLDVDCVPSPELVARYANVARYLFPDALLSGTVAYLPPPPPDGYQLGQLAALATPHADRPNPAWDSFEPLSHELFWSLSFALTTRTWNRIGGFCEDYVGYGGEDTDFAESARCRDVDHIALGGAIALHQWHPAPDPPLNHFADILRNANIYYTRWGKWPMRGWLDAFSDLGLIRYDHMAGTWNLTQAGENTASGGQLST